MPKHNSRISFLSDLNVARLSTSGFVAIAKGLELNFLGLAKELLDPQSGGECHAHPIVTSASLAVSGRDRTVGAK